MLQREPGRHSPRLDGAIVSHAGQFWQFEDVELVPKPHPPIWVAATVTPEKLRGYRPDGACRS
jgi:alkanesulfonate monooxygenase SsuD/methylene tetrahydromethanopterin reductase-like flavin-dependent oxidoreductase (luciferase family)